MARRVVVVDYGMGNLRSVWQAVRHAAEGLNADVQISSSAQAVRDAERVVLPGQGAMRDCMRELDAAGLRQAVLEAAATKPLFGVCVGMQMLLQHSEEQDTPGLGLFPGECRRFRLEGRLQPDGSRFKVPQMGWNRVQQMRRSPSGGTDNAARPHALWAGIDDGAWFYFVHSFHAVPSEARHSAGETDYGGRFTSAVARDNIFATQFHPEKSARAGLTLYRNFLAWNP